MKFECFVLDLIVVWIVVLISHTLCIQEACPLFTSMRIYQDHVQDITTCIGQDTRPENPCGPSWKYYASRSVCFKALSGRLNWEENRLCCSQSESEMLKIDDIEMEEFIQANVITNYHTWNGVWLRKTAGKKRIEKGKCPKYQSSATIQADCTTPNIGVCQKSFVHLPQEPEIHVTRTAPGSINYIGSTIKAHCLAWTGQPHWNDKALTLSVDHEEKRPRVVPGFPFCLEAFMMDRNVILTIPFEKVRCCKGNISQNSDYTRFCDEYDGVQVEKGAFTTPVLTLSDEGDLLIGSSFNVTCRGTLLKRGAGYNIQLLRNGSWEKDAFDHNSSVSTYKECESGEPNCFDTITTLTVVVTFMFDGARIVCYPFFPSQTPSTSVFMNANEWITLSAELNVTARRPIHTERASTFDSVNVMLGTWLLLAAFMSVWFMVDLWRNRSQIKTLFGGGRVERGGSENPVGSQSQFRESLPLETQELNQAQAAQSEPVIGTVCEASTSASD